MSFSTTFLGHQGWAVRTDSTFVLVDPLLAEDFGAAQSLQYKVWPPRRWTLSELPPVDAVILSHEHDDHFDIPSLARLDRAVPIYLSARSSPAAGAILGEMGFTVKPLVPGGKLEIGDLEVLAFAGDHMTTNCGEEWDTLPYVVRHKGGGGSLFSMVDIPLTPGHVEWVRAAVSRPGLVTWTNNSVDWSHMTDWMKPRTDATKQKALAMGQGRQVLSAWGTPQAMLMCAGGFSFTGDREWLNHRAFCVDIDVACAAMQEAFKRERFVAAKPGQTFVMKNGKLDKIEPHAPWLATEAPETWPDRTPRPAPSPVPDFEPATGKKQLAPGELDELARRLDDFAGTLVGGNVFKNLCSLLATEHPRPTFAFVARDGDARHAFVYDLPACRFQRVDSPPNTMAGLECWGADLLAVLRAELGPLALSFARARLWNALPQRFKFAIFDELYKVSHPMRRPEAYLAIYRRLYAAVADTQPTVRARS